MPDNDGGGHARIALERHGGFVARPPLTVSVDTRELPPGEASALEEAVGAGFFALPADMTNPGVRDAFSYTVTVEREGRSHTVRTNDPVPEPLQALVQRLTRLAQDRRRADRPPS
jgi:hypothetical protein